MATAYVIFGDGTRVCAEVADTDAARSRGLMFRGVSGDETGMLFVFDRADRYGFWMKDVPTPLDIIWLDSRRRVLSIVDSAPPCDRQPCPTYHPAADAVFVLEVSGGFARRHAVTIGDTVTIEANTPWRTMASRSPGSRT